MAEIRKHNPAAGALGDLVRAAIGDGPRPIQPGATPAPNDDPFDAASPASPTAASTAGAPAKAPPAATFVPAAAGWKAVSIEQLPTVTAARPPSSDDEFDELDDDDWEDEFPTQDS